VERRLFLLILGAIFLIGYSPLFALGQDAYDKDEAIFSAFREEAMQESLQAVEMDALLNDMEKSDIGGEPFSGFSFERQFYLGSDIIYSDNVWNVADEVKSDLWLSLKPGLKLALGNILDLAANKFRQKLELDIGADITHSFYRSVALNRESPYARLAYSLEGGRNKLTLSNYFIKGYDLASSLVFDTQGLIGFDGNTSVLDWEYSFNRLGLGLAYERDAKRYFKRYKASNSYEDNTGIITGFFKITPKTRVFLEYDLGRYEYTRTSADANNYDYNTLWVGANGQLTKKLFGLAKLGYENYKYDSGTTKDGMMTVKTDLEFRHSPRTTFLLNISVGETSTGYVDLGIDKQYSFKLGFLRHLNRKLELSGDLSYVNDNYKTGQVDDTYGFSLTLNYLFQKWMKLKLGYVYSDRTSTSHSAECKYNKYFFGTELAF
jgi:hypothetical protein